MPRKAILKFNNEVIYPRTSLDNLVAVYGSTTPVSVPYLDENGKLDPSYLPSYVDDIVELQSITTAPATAAVGDMYYNDTSKKIFTASAVNTWGETGEDPEAGKIYVDVTTDKIYRYGGSASGMVEISKQISTVTTVRTVDGGASNTVVPTELAVATALASVAVAGHTHAISDVTGLQDALDAKQATLTQGEGINISNATVSIAAADSAGTNAKKGGVIVDTTASNGISITNNSGTIAASASTATKSANGFGVVAVGTNIDVSNGTISVASASTSTPGIAQLEGNIGTASGDALNNPPTTDAVKTYVNAQILAGVTCELL